MMHFSCDGCGKNLGSGTKPRFIVKIEIYPAQNPNQLSEADLDADHLEEVSQLLKNLEETQDTFELADQNHQLQYDLCPDCRQKYLRDPLGKDLAPKMHFSKN